jgi:hypothetical protein
MSGWQDMIQSGSKNLVKFGYGMVIETRSYFIFLPLFVEGTML